MPPFRFHRLYRSQERICDGGMVCLIDRRLNALDLIGDFRRPSDKIGNRRTKLVLGGKASGKFII